MRYELNKGFGFQAWLFISVGGAIIALFPFPLGLLHSFGHGSGMDLLVVTMIAGTLVAIFGIAVPVAVVFTLLLDRLEAWDLLTDWTALLASLLIAPVGFLIVSRGDIVAGLTHLSWYAVVFIGGAFLGLAATWFWCRLTGQVRAYKPGVS